MSTIQELITKLFNLIVSDETCTRNRYLKSSSLIEQLRIIIEIVTQFQHKKTFQAYKALEKELQKYESEYRNHIRDEYLIQQNQNNLISRLEEIEREKNELFSTLKLTIIKLKRENEQLYQKVKQLTFQIKQHKNLTEKLLSHSEKCKANDYSTHDSTKIIQSENSTIENHNQRIIKLKTHTTPKKLHIETSVDISVIAAINDQIKLFKKKGSITQHQHIKNN